MNPNLDQAIAAAREALAAYHANSTRHYIDEALEDVLAALDAARGEEKMPAPAFRLTWREGQHRVNKPNIGDTDCYTAEQVREMLQAPPAAAVPEGVHVFQCHRCPVSVESRWQPPDCPECGDPCVLDASAKLAPPAAAVPRFTDIEAAARYGWEHASWEWESVRIGLGEQDQQPAAAVPAEMTVERAQKIGEPASWAVGWNACRAAMLAPRGHRHTGLTVTTQAPPAALADNVIESLADCLLHASHSLHNGREMETKNAIQEALGMLAAERSECKATPCAVPEGLRNAEQTLALLIRKYGDEADAAALAMLAAANKESNND